MEIELKVTLNSVCRLAAISECDLCSRDKSAGACLVAVSDCVLEEVKLIVSRND